MERNDTRPGASIDVQALLAEVESLTRLAERSGSSVTAGTDAPRRAERPKQALAAVAAGPVIGEAAGQAVGETHPLDAASLSMAPGTIGRGPVDPGGAPVLDDGGRTARAVQIAMPVASPEPPARETASAEPPARARGGAASRRTHDGGSRTAIAAGERRRADDRPAPIDESDPRPMPQATARGRTRSNDGDAWSTRGFETTPDATVGPKPRRSVLGLIATLPLRLFALPIDLLPPAGRTLVSILAASMILATPLAWLLAWRTSTQSGVGPIPAANLPRASASEPKPAPMPAPEDPGLSPASAPAR